MTGPLDRYPQAFMAAWPQRYHGISTPWPGQEAAWKLVAARARACFTDTVPARPHRSDGVILLGKTGRGKTALAALISKLCDQKLHVTPHLVRCADLRVQLRGLPSEREVDFPEIIEACRPARAPLLVVDDVGVEKGVQDAEELVRTLVDIRDLEPCFTICTANLDMGDFVTHLGGARQDSRLSPLQVIELNTLPDYRKEPRHA